MCLMSKHNDKPLTDMFIVLSPCIYPVQHNIENSLPKSHLNCRAWISGEKSEFAQHFEFSRTFFNTGSRAIAGWRAEWQSYQCWKKGGKIQNVLPSSDFEIFSPEVHARFARNVVNWDFLSDFQTLCARGLMRLCSFVLAELIRTYLRTIVHVRGLGWKRGTYFGCILMKFVTSSERFIRCVKLFFFSSSTYVVILSLESSTKCRPKWRQE